MDNQADASPMLAPSTRITALDGVRGIAILAVVVGHGICPISTTSEWARLIKAIISYCTFGVDLFFVLSGFLITTILVRNHASKNLLKVFWIRRAARITPLYFLFLVTLATFCYVFMPDQLPSPPMWSYFTYLQNFYLAAGAPVNYFGFDITWSLAIEEHFYLLFPFLIVLFPIKHVWKLVLIVFLSGFFFRHLLHPWLESSFGLQRLDSLFLTGRIDQLGGGAFLAMALMKGWMPRFLFSPPVALLFWALSCVMKLSGYGDHLFPAIAGILTVGIAVKGERIIFRKILEMRFLVFLGRISYALYLFHTPFFWYAHSRLTGAPALLAVCLSAAVAGMCAWMSTRYFEEPIQRMARAFHYDK